MRLTSIPPVGRPILFKSTQKVGQIGKYKPTFYQSGTAALALAISTIKNKYNKSNPEVLLPAYCCPDLISACQYSGVIPVLVDLEFERSWMSLNLIEENITENTIAIIAVNFLGIPERISEIRKIIENKKICIIEDSAQYFPVNIDSCNWTGDFVILSFGRGKPVSLLHGGAILVNSNSDFYDQLSENSYLPQANLSLVYPIKLMLYGILIQPFFYNLLESIPFVRLGLTRFKKLESIKLMDSKALDLLFENIKSYQKQKFELLSRYRSCLEKLATDNIINLPKVSDIDENVPLLRYPVLLKNESQRNLVLNELQKKGLGATSMYERPLQDIEGIPGGGIKYRKHDNATDFASRLLTLPTHFHVDNTRLTRICQVLQKVK